MGTGLTLTFDNFCCTLALVKTDAKEHVYSSDVNPFLCPCEPVLDNLSLYLVD